MKPFLATLAVVAAITGAIVAFVLRDAAATSKRLSAEAEPVGFVATPTRWYDSGDEQDVDGHTLTFAFVDADNAVHSKTMEQVTWYDARRGYKVCYNPADAEEFKLYPADHVCGS